MKKEKLKTITVYCQMEIQRDLDQLVIATPKELYYVVDEPRHKVLFAANDLEAAERWAYPYFAKLREQRLRELLGKAQDDSLEPEV